MVKLKSSEHVGPRLESPMLSMMLKGSEFGVRTCLVDRAPISSG
jgi:hypothetical protein